MTLPSGARVGPYEIVSLRGVGGMGQVYRARDTRLDRAVAIKVLPPGLEANEELRARFEREARAISSLSHPNICALFDVGRDGETEYLVMEYLDGETLAEKLARGPLPQSLVVRYGSQMAAALQHAHRAGITHRDLKPGNLMITAEGVKLLDFGLAKLIEKTPRVHSDLSAPATEANPITAQGMIVGTAHYMSPEQLEGKPLDHRTDIFALGVVLYEMATGQRPFKGDSAASLVAAILSRDPVPVRSIQPAVTAALERIILTALEKNPDERWQTSRDLGRQLQWIGESTSGTASETTSARPVVLSAQQRRLPPVVAIVAAVLAGAFLTWGALRGSTSSRPAEGNVCLQLALPPGMIPTQSKELVNFAISPDGRKIAFVAYREGRSSLYVRRLDAFEFTEIRETEGASSPFWSSDGNWIGFSARENLWKVTADGKAPPVGLCRISAGGARATWHGTTILFAEFRGGRAGILRVQDSGGTPVEVTSIAKGEWRHTWPCLLPDGKHFIYERFASGSPDRSLVLASLDSPGESVLIRNVSLARMVGPERLAFVRDGSLMAQTIDLKKGVLVGEPTLVGSDVPYFHMTGEAGFDASPTGVIVYLKDTSTGRLVLRNRAGRETKEVGTGLFRDAALSPDGRRAAVSVVASNTGLMDVWIYDLARGVRDRFTSDPAVETAPEWTPDGGPIIYSQSEGGMFPHLVRRAVGGTTSEDVTPRGSFQLGATFTPDGRTVYYEQTDGTGSDIYRVDLEKKVPEPVLKGGFNESDPAVSPDGRRLAYSSDASGSGEVYVMSLESSGSSPVRVSAGGGREPRWGEGGRELVYLRPDGTFMSATLRQSGRWDDVLLQELFHVQYPVQHFDVAADGQSILISTWSKGEQDKIFNVVIGDAQPRR